ncbi:dermatopontin [Biomphalaria glabrata]|nr:dermatopontin-like dual oxidase-like P Cell adhesion/Resistant factor [Biomphalaria glabrata]
MLCGSLLLSFISLLISGVYNGVQSFDDYTTDGFRNNLNQPTWGIAGSNFMRSSPVAYTDGAYEMAGKDRPNPLEISLRAHRKMQDSPSRFSRNVLQTVYAQLVMDEVAQTYMTGCPPEYEHLELPEGHPLKNFTHRPMVYARSSYDQTTGYASAGPRQQVNLVSSFLDGGVIYGGSQVWTNLLRSFSGGELLADTTDLKSSFPLYNDVKLPFYNAPIPRDHTFKPVNRLFRIGNAKGHENPYLLALQVVWFRWHNKVARDLASKSNETDEEIFERTKRKVIAAFQKIAVKEWLPAFLNGNTTDKSSLNLANYSNYMSRAQPGITQEFLAAMEVRNSILPSAVEMLE